MRLTAYEESFERLVSAAERIADALEGKGGHKLRVEGPIVTIDGKQISRAVMENTLARAARGPSTMVGGALATGNSKNEGKKK